jgi:hypothetical protein
MMAKTAKDAFFGTNTEPLSAARKAAVVTPSDNQDLPFVTSSLIVTIGTGGTGIAVLMADAPDTAPITIPLVPGTYKLEIQVRRVMANNTNLGSGGGVVAMWS